jgi:hypothetical protein
MPRTLPALMPIVPPPLNLPALYSTLILAGSNSWVSNSNSPAIENPSVDEAFPEMPPLPTLSISK